MTTENIKKAQEALQTGFVDPNYAQELRNRLSGEYSFYTTQLTEILSRKPKTWLQLRDASKSDTQADRKYEMTEDGINEIGIRHILKSIEKMLSSLKTVVDVETNNRNYAGL